jgi:hypothetical protein
MQRAARPDIPRKRDDGRREFSFNGDISTAKNMIGTEAIAMTKSRRPHWMGRVAPTATFKPSEL